MTAAAPSRTITLGSRNITVEPFSGRKALRAFHMLKQIATDAPAIMQTWHEFTAEYEREHALELSRAEARFEFPPIRGDVTELDRLDAVPVEVRGDEWQRERDAAIAKVMRPGRFDHLTDQDWEKSGNRVRLPRSPSQAEQIVAVFPTALELAEEQVLRLLALIAMPEADVKAHRGDLNDKLDVLAEDLLDAPFEDLVELAVIGGESVNDQYVRKTEKLGDRVGNALRLVGIKTKPREPSPTAKPSSSTSSGAPTDGAKTKRSRRTTSS